MCSSDLEDFDGVALQGAGKAGEFILDDNKKAVAKIVIGEDASGDNTGPEGDNTGPEA